MSTSTDRTKYREILATLAQKTTAKLPALNGRVEKAVKLALLGDVELHEDGAATVYSSSDPTRRYELREGTCVCRDWEQAPEHLCAHRLAAGLARKAQELMGTPSEPEEVPEHLTPLPEAPCSITLKATLHGYEVLVTLRGHDFASVQAQVEQAVQWLQRQAPRTGRQPRCGLVQSACGPNEAQREGWPLLVVPQNCPWLVQRKRGQAMTPSVSYRRRKKFALPTVTS